MSANQRQISLNLEDVRLSLFALIGEEKVSASTHRLMAC